MAGSLVADMYFDLQHAVHQHVMGAATTLELCTGPFVLIA